jgi:hypothetical protein
MVHAEPSRLRDLKERESAEAFASASTLSAPSPALNAGRLIFRGEKPPHPLLQALDIPSSIL